MILTPEVASVHGVNDALRAMARSLASTIALTLVVVASAQAYSAYSGASVGSSGTIYGWGVTEASDYYMTHTAYVTTTLRSPKGRAAYSGMWAGGDTVRADISLSWDATDLGTYTTTSQHQYYCPLGGLIPMGESTNYTTVPFVVLSLRNSGEVSSDNSARGEYQFQLGTYNLGTFFSSGATIRIFRTGVEVVGTVYPSSYTGQIILNRVRDVREYLNNNSTPYRSENNVPDGPSDPALRDDYPQSGGSLGKIYDVDAPGIGSAEADPVGTVRRKRANFRQWAELSDGTYVSGYLQWYSRLSVVKAATGDQLKTDISGDNKAGSGTTRLTWNLQ